MKKILNFMGITALTLVIAFTMTACPKDDDGDKSPNNNGNGSPYLGLTPTLSGPVYVVNWDSNTGTSTYEEYKGDDLEVSSYDLNEKGNITNGILSYTIGTPKNLQNINDILRSHLYSDENYDNLTVSTSSANGGLISSFTVVKISNSNSSGSLRIESENSIQNYYDVEYFFVDKDVTINAKGKLQIIQLLKI